MKKVFFIALLAITASGCALSSKAKVEPPTLRIGMNENDFKSANRRARLVYLSNDSAVYEVFKGSGEQLTLSDFYHFSQNRLYKFEQKTHYFNSTTVKIEELKDKKN